MVALSSLSDDGSAAASPPRRRVKRNLSAIVKARVSPALKAALRVEQRRTGLSEGAIVRAALVAYFAYADRGPNSTKNTKAS